jgi:hypothetical protein
VHTRPLGESVADWLGKPVADGGLGVGSGAGSMAVPAAITVLVASLAQSRADRPAAVTVVEEGWLFASPAAPRTSTRPPPSCPRRAW